MSKEEEIRMEDYKKEFNEHKFWNKLKKIFPNIGYESVNKILVLFYVFKEQNVPMKVKVTIAGALGYLIVPFDLIPDFAPMGYTDDLSAILAVLEAIEFYVTPEIRQKAKDKTDEFFNRN